MRIRFLIASVLLFATAPRLSASEPLLKLDVPKLDTAEPKPAPSGEGKKSLLRGQVEQVEEPATGKLFSSIGKDTHNNKFAPQSGKANLDRRSPLQAQTKQSTFNSGVESGIGIIGVRFVIGYGSPPIINRVFPGTPAWQIGLKPNDIIVAVDGIPTLGLAKEEVYDMIVGTPNTPVTLSVRRKGDYQAHTLNRMDFNDITDPAVKRDYLLSM